MVRKTQRANVVTMIPGYSENSSSTSNRAKSSAIPGGWDKIFHGDFRQSLPTTLTSALKTKSLQEYPSRTFPNYRVRTGLKLSFETNGKTISSPTVSQERALSPITLEGGPGESSIGREALAALDGSNGFLEANKKGPFFKMEEAEPINGIEGLRASLIFGGNDTYLVRAKKLGIPLGTLLAGLVPTVLADYYFRLPAFYAFVDVVFMADGAKIVRVWDASRYPAHALYLGDSRVDKTPFREGTEWTKDGTNQAFGEFRNDALTPDETPFRPLAPLNYRNAYKNGEGPHPVMEEVVATSEISEAALRNNFTKPMFPSPF